MLPETFKSSQVLLSKETYINHKGAHISIYSVSENSDNGKEHMAYVTRKMRGLL